MIDAPMQPELTVRLKLDRGTRLFLSSKLDAIAESQRRQLDAIRAELAAIRAMLDTTQKDSDGQDEG